MVLIGLARVHDEPLSANRFREVPDGSDLDTKELAIRKDRYALVSRIPVRFFCNPAFSVPVLALAWVL